MKETFQNFVDICKKSKELCPWSKNQDTKRFTEEMIGEANEVLGAISTGNNDHIKEELGDVLIDWVHACLSSKIDIKEIITGAKAKIERRKPFLAEDRQVTLEEAKKFWTKAKEDEKTQNEKSINLR